VSTISYGTIKVFEPYSIYTMRLAKQGKLLTHEKDKAVLTLLKMDSVIETDFLSVRPEMTLKEMVDVIARSNRNLFPVLNAAGELLGVVQLDDIRNIMFRPDLYRKMNVASFMTMPSDKIIIGEPMETVMKKFGRHRRLEPAGGRRRRTLFRLHQQKQDIQLLSKGAETLL